MKSAYDRFRAWTANGLWSAILSRLSTQHCDNEYLTIDSTAVRVHAHGGNPSGDQMAQAMGRSRSSLPTKVHVACDALGYPLGFILTAANVSDFDQAKPLLRQHIQPRSHAPMDKGYDSDAIRAFVNQLRGFAVVPQNPIVRPNPLLTSTSIANATASRTSLLASKPPVVSPPATKNSTPPSHPCSPSHAS
jgi:transposase